MNQSLAIWHYPYRTGPENILYWASKGFDALSQHGMFFYSDISEPESRTALTDAIRSTGIRFTVHHYLPYSYLNYSTENFQSHILAFRDWQKETGLLWNLSFDVFPENRPHASEYVRFVLDAFEGLDTRISVEDYGLTPEEREDLEPLRAYKNFGYLCDLGHMNLRLHNPGTPCGHPAAEQQGEAAPLPIGDGSPEAFYNALCCKNFPIYEFHLHNNNGKADQHRYVEDGVIDIPGLARSIKKFGFDGVCTFEVVPDWIGDDAYKAEQKAKEQEMWSVMYDTFHRPAFTGNPDPARDERVLKSFAYWRKCMEEA